MKQTVKVECGSCGATGIYRGFAEPEGVGVVCLNCRGTGCTEITYTPFERRKERRDVERVQYSRGSLLAIGVGPVGSSIGYREFLEGKMP